MKREKGLAYLREVAKKRKKRVFKPPKKKILDIVKVILEIIFLGLEIFCCIQSLIS